VVTRALNEEPQRGQTVVIRAEDESVRLVDEKSQCIDGLISDPGLDGVDLDRDRSSMRDVNL